MVAGARRNTLRQSVQSPDLSVGADDPKGNIRAAGRTGRSSFDGCSRSGRGAACRLARAVVAHELSGDARAAAGGNASEAHGYRRRELLHIGWVAGVSDGDADP